MTEAKRTVVKRDKNYICKSELILLTLRNQSVDFFLFIHFLFVCQNRGKLMGEFIFVKALSFLYI